MASTVADGGADAHPLIGGLWEAGAARMMEGVYVTVRPVVRRRIELVRRVQQVDGVADVFAEASPRLRRLVPFDAAAWVSTDPATGLPTAPTRIENMDEAEPAQCLAFWRREHLSGREQQITRLIARGLSTADIADELFLSPHTVRDHVKAVFHKVEVSSRGELVAKLFAEHYWPDHGSDIVRVTDS